MIDLNKALKPNDEVVIYHGRQNVKIYWTTFPQLDMQKIKNTKFAMILINFY